MPIKGLSQVRRLPRLGHLRLGVKAQKKVQKGKETKLVEYPKEVDYFVIDPMTSDPKRNEQLKQQFLDLYGERPTSIDIMFPPTSPDLFFAQWFKRYGSGSLLKCKGDGEEAVCGTKEWAKDLEVLGDDERGMLRVKCAGRECPYYLSGECREMAALQVILPRLSGIGVWQINTGSFNSIVNMNSAIDWLKGLCGRYSMVPIKLMRVATDIAYEGKRSKHYILQIDQDSISIGQIQQIALTPETQVLIPGPDESKDALFYPDRCWSFYGRRRLRKRKHLDMARSRYLDKSFFKDEDIAALPYPAQRLYQGLWMLADREGRLEDRPLRIKAEIFPYTNEGVDNLLITLATPKASSGRPFIVRYEVDGQRYIQILQWDKYQRPHKTERVSTIPPPPNVKNTLNNEQNTLEPEKIPTITENGVLSIENGERRKERESEGEEREEDKDRIFKKRTEEIRHQIDLFYDLTSYLRLTKQEQGELLKLASLIPRNLWDKWINELYRSRPLQDKWAYWQGGLNARMNEHEGEILKKGPTNIGAILKQLALSLLIFFIINSNASAEEGIASWYGGDEKLNKYTANGEIFNPEDKTCASWAYPFGTMLAVHCPETGQTVFCRVNDRGPARRLKRPIDLSKGAFRKLAPLKKGLIYVKITRAK